MTYDFNSSLGKRNHFSASLNALVDEANESTDEKARTYLGASQIGGNCDRRSQYEIMGVAGEPFTAKTRRIFARGHTGEELMAGWLRKAGFDLSTHKANGDQHGFMIANGKMGGHCDGIIVECAHTIVGMEFPCLWENKVLGLKSWKAIVKDGVRKATPQYAAQIWLYQAYLDLTAPCLFTAICADTMEVHYELVEFDEIQAQAVSDRGAHIVRATAAGDLLPRVASSPDAFPCSWCRHVRPCWEGAQ